MPFLFSQDVLTLIPPYFEALAKSTSILLITIRAFSVVRNSYACELFVLPLETVVLMLPSNSLASNGRDRVASSRLVTSEYLVTNPIDPAGSASGLHSPTKEVSWPTYEPCAGRSSLLPRSHAAMAASPIDADKLPFIHLLNYVSVGPSAPAKPVAPPPDLPVRAADSTGPAARVTELPTMALSLIRLVSVGPSSGLTRFMNPSIGNINAFAFDSYEDWLALRAHPADTETTKEELAGCLEAADSAAVTGNSLRHSSDCGPAMPRFAPNITLSAVSFDPIREANWEPGVPTSPLVTEELTGSDPRYRAHPLQVVAVDPMIA